MENFLGVVIPAIQNNLSLIYAMNCIMYINLTGKTCKIITICFFQLDKATQLRFSRDIMKRFSDTKLSLKRKMSRKGEKKLEPHLGDNDCLGDTPQCSSNDETPYGSSNTKEIGSPPQNKNQDIENTQKSTYNQQNNNSEFGMSLFTTVSNELEEGGNTLPKSDDSFQNNENNPADIVGLGIDERPKTNGDHSKTPKEGVTQTDDSTSKN